MTVGSIVGGGFRLVREQPKAVAIWAVVLLLASGLSIALLMPLFQDMAREQMAQAANAATQPPVFHPERLAWIFLFDLVLALIYVVLFAASVRATARIGSGTLGYLRVGMDELRLIGLILILTHAAILAEVVAVLGVVFVGVVLGLVAGKAATTIVLVILGAIAFGGLIFAQVRLSLAGVLTVLRGRITIGESWSLTMGRFWRLFGAYLVLTLGFMIVSVGLLAMVNPHLVAAYFSFDQQAILAAGQEQMARQASHPVAALLPQLLLGAVVTGVVFAIFSGEVTTATLELEAEAAAQSDRPSAGSGPWS